MIGLPLDHDLLDGDLDSHFPGFSEGTPLLWGIAVSAVSGSWDEEVNIPGLDWQVRLCPPGKLHIPRTVRKPSPRMSWHTVKSHCALLGVATGKTTVNEARDIGRLGVRRLGALLRREIATLQLADVLWEGALVRSKAGKLRFLAAKAEMEAVRPKTPDELHKLGLKLAPIAVTRLPGHVGKSLEWLALARSARVKIEKFTHLWLAVIALTDHGVDTENLSQRQRISTYTANMGGFLSRTALEGLTARLKADYDVRNELWHEGKDASITPESLRILEADAFTLIDYEFVKLKTPIPE